MGALEQTLLTWAHLVSAAIWVGGSIFIGVVLAPLLRGMYDSQEERLRLMIAVGRRFNKIAVPSLLVLVATGAYSSRHLLADPGVLAEGSSYGAYLLAKMALVALLAAVFAAHVRIIRGDVEARIMGGRMSAPQLRALRRRIMVLGEATVAISVAVLFFAAALDSGL